MKKICLLLGFITLLFANSSPCKAVQDYYEDTVWVKKTDQLEGFYQVKFSNNDSIIVAHGYSQDHFYDTKTGNLIVKINGTEEIFFINNDENFIKLNQDRTVFEIFDMKTFKVIDSLESDGTIINEYSKLDVSKDGKYLVAPIPRGFRIWDISSKKILKTKIFPDELNLNNVGVNNLRFVCGNEKIIAQYVKIYNNPNKPENPITIGSFTVWDFNTLDSIDSYENSRGFKLSNNCNYIAYIVGSKDYGVEIYDFTTKELVQKLEINGYNLTGIEFSPDDKYIVTSNGPGTNSLIVWSLDSGKEVYIYPYGSHNNIDISNNGKFIISSTGGYLFLWNFKNETSIIENDKEKYLKTIYPNPATGNVTIDFNLISSGKTIIEVVDLKGEIIKSIFNGFLEIGNNKVTINTTDISSGSYFVIVQSEQEKIVFQLIIEH